ncbi:hypothetical protein [Chromatium okenii]|uniref:hypothetical protein n=1 Tax=Chromatium okenii TaxID=61644 RepID=UPI0019071BA2|nr:hypothetical protein [Chromatium okenii]
MNLTYYISVYSLAEALVLSIILTLFFGIQWWRIRRVHHHYEAFCAAGLALFKQDIQRLHAFPNARTELQDSHIAVLKMLAAPFKTEQLQTLAAWEHILQQLEQHYEHLAQVTQSRAPHPIAHAQSDCDLASCNHDELHHSGIATEQLDAAVGELLSQYQATTATIALNQEATAEIKHNFEALQLANQELRSRIQVNQDREIREKLDAVEQSNAAFMRALAVKERNYKLLIKEHETLQIHIHNLQISITEYRKAVHKLLLKQDSLIEENKLLREQNDSTTKLVGQLNRSYDTLRNEYTKLFETTR